MIQQVVSSSFSQGLVWAVMALGVYVTFRLLNISDLSAEGVFPLGGIIAARLITLPSSPAVAGWSAGAQSLVDFLAHPVVATLMAMLGGALAGWLAGMIHTKMLIPPLLTGILMQTGLYSINLHVSDGQSNIPLLGQTTIYSGVQEWTLGGVTISKNFATMIVAAVILAILILVLVLFLHTELGLSLRSTGDNEAMSQANGVNTDRMKTLGYMIGNGLIGLAGALVAQKDSFADIQMGMGTIVIGLSSIIIAEVIIPNLSIGGRLTSIIVGSFLYRLIIDFILNQPWIAIRSTDLRLFSSILLALVLFFPEFQKRWSQKSPKRNGGSIQ